MTELSRRDLLALMAVGASTAGLSSGSAAAGRPGKETALDALRIRAIVAGVEISGPGDKAPVEKAVARLLLARQRAHDAGFEVQTLRVATNPVIAPLDAGQRRAALGALRELDAVVAAHEAMLSIGPVSTANRFEPQLGDWAAELARTTRMISFSVAVSSPEEGIHRDAIRSAAHVISALARVDATGAANFRFAAAAGIPAGTPFFPVAYHRGASSIAFGIESAGLVQAAFTGLASPADAEGRLRELLERKLGQIERLGREIAAAGSVQYLGIDPSPAPGLDRSIGTAIETLTGVPFGHPSTLQACATITAVLKSLKVQTCGYAGLMLPVLEDPTLALRAHERRYGLQELLLYSAVCGTGLDVVPLPGDIDVTALSQIIGDVATLAVRLRKPLSARLFPAPGRKSGDMVRFADERLVECRVFDI